MSDYTKPSPIGAAVFSAAITGAVIGGTAAAARSIRKVKKGLMTKEDAAKTVAREAGTTSLATSTAAAVVTGLGLGGIVSLVGMALVATGTKYVLDQKFAPEPVSCLVPVEGKEEKAVAKKAAPKKTAKKKTAPKKFATKKVAQKKTAAPKAASTTEPTEKES